MCPPKCGKPILPNSNIETAQYSRMAEVQVNLCRAGDEAEEYRWVWAQAQAYASAGTPVVVLLPTHDAIHDFVSSVCRVENLALPATPRVKGKPDYTGFNVSMEANGRPLRYLGNKYGSLITSDERPIVYVMTYHSAKGLDFETVFLPGLTASAWFARDEERAQKLFFVGLTRSRKNLFLSYHGDAPHHFLERIPEQLVRKTTPQSSEQAASGPDVLF